MIVLALDEATATISPQESVVLRRKAVNCVIDT
jgi:hypothetical protein